MEQMDWLDFKTIKKEQHNKRVAKTPDRLQYAAKMLNKNNVAFEIKNAETGHVHVRNNDKLYQFWAGTGKILGSDKRGIDNFLRMVKTTYNLNLKTI